MSEPENFLGRWSRRKRDVADEPAPAKPQGAAKSAPARPPGDPQTAEVPFDPASLPSLDSIAADSDLRAFLKPGVPPDLARAALRRAWSADPAIRDFVGLVENGWDFNNPDAMPGFGPLSDADVANLLAQVVGNPQPTEPVVQQSAAAQETPAAAGEGLAQRLQQDGPMPTQVAAAPKKEGVRRNEDIAMQNDSDEKFSAQPTRQRGHGGALPK